MRVDPVTGKPIKGDGVPNIHHNLEKYQKADEDLSAVESEAAKRLVTMIENLLTARVENILYEDPACKAYLSVLQEMGRKRKYARHTIQNITKKFGAPAP
jgi:putative protein kinase ArgK-like GTPase of G3E family